MVSKIEKSFILLLILFLFLTSCSTFFKVAYGFNKKFKFKTKDSYISFLQLKKNIDSKNIIFPDTNSRSLFLQSIFSDSLSIYYGCLISDSVEMIKTSELRDNLSCMGRVLADIRLGETMLNNNDSSLFTRSRFKMYKFNFLINDAQVNINQSGKKLKIIMLYSYSLGRYFDKTFDEVRRFHEDHKEFTDLYIITLDDVYRLQ